MCDCIIVVGLPSLDGKGLMKLPLSVWPKVSMSVC